MPPLDDLFRNVMVEHREALSALQIAAAKISARRQLNETPTDDEVEVQRRAQLRLDDARDRALWVLYQKV